MSRTTASPLVGLSRWLFVTWFPVIIMLTAIAVESTHTFSSQNTSGWLRGLYQELAGPVSDERWVHVHYLIRKTGHFTGYGLLGVAWVRGWLLFWLEPLKHQTISVWRGYCVAMAVFCTMLVASLDELHQSFMADRTGAISDVWLDTTGAMMMVFLFVAIMPFRKRNY